MRRADRLFQLVQLVRGRRLSTAEFLAQRLEVSVRTVYRDIADLQHHGVPIQGEAGVGYRLGKGFELPPLMFSHDEAQALVASVRVAQTWLDPEMANAALRGLSKILSVLPSGTRTAAQSLPLYAPLQALAPETHALLSGLRAAAQAQQRVHLSYCDEHGCSSQRSVQPLGCFFWGKVWTLAAWCEARESFRSFRLDRIQSWQLAQGPAAHFQASSGRTLADYLRANASEDAVSALTADS
ncbi:helix-turn-helix transcriptional regulator [Roseateles sp. BYS180W]|uniref:Helix-turn-helix transcriptional regulator n=1 Tax=Roseateles rivi TaxID=3299028 RepID=A0ABW7FT69_9BURK